MSKLKRFLGDSQHISYESLLIGSLLAIAGGYLDVYSYLLKGGVFANAQTGNMVLLGIAFAEGDFSKVFYYFIPIFAFFSGVIVTELIRKRYRQNGHIQWRQNILLLEAILLFIIGLLPKGIPDAAVNITISFVCSVQVCCFRSLRGMPYATTMCTGNLRSATEQFYRFVWLKEKEAGKKCARYFIIILFFCIGAAVATNLCRIWEEPSIWVCCALFLIVYLLLAIHDRVKRRDSQNNR